MEQMDIMRQLAALPREVLGAMESEMQQYRYLTLRPTAFRNTAGFKTYGEIPFYAFRSAMQGVPVEQMALKLTEDLKTARESLDPISTPEAVCWYLWGDQMPQEPDADSYSYRGCADNPGFKPFLLPYLLENPMEAKGNIICVAGGGFDQRANFGEGYPVAEYFRKLGYNAYVLQRRVKPFRPVDSMLDLQRAVRFLRFHAESLRLGGLDCMCAIGFSGGSGTVLGTISKFYGNILPNTEYPDYIPDEIDAVNSDMDVIISHYGPGFTITPDGFTGELDTTNPKLPAIFMASGELDCLNATLPYLNLYKCLHGKTTVEMHLYADADHGYALGEHFADSEYHNEHTNTRTWMPLADEFIQLQIQKKTSK